MGTDSTDEVGGLRPSTVGQKDQGPWEGLPWPLDADTQRRSRVTPLAGSSPGHYQNPSGNNRISAYSKVTPASDSPPMLNSISQLKNDLHQTNHRSLALLRQIPLGVRFLPQLFFRASWLLVRRQLRSSSNIATFHGSLPTSTSASVTGRLNRRGPALPGFKYRTPSRSHCSAWWVCPLITASNPAASGRKSNSLRLCSTYSLAPPVSTMAVAGSSAAQASVSTFPRTANTGAIAFNCVSTAGFPTSPACMIRSTPLNARAASGRSSPCVSEMIPNLIRVSALSSIFLRHIIFGHFARLHLGLVGISRVLHSVQNLCFKRLPFLQKFFHTFGIAHRGPLEPLCIARLSGRIGPQPARFVGHHIRRVPAPRNTLLPAFPLTSWASLPPFYLRAGFAFGLAATYRFCSALLSLFSWHDALRSSLSLPLCRPPRAAVV